MLERSFSEEKEAYTCVKAFSDKSGWIDLVKARKTCIRAIHIIRELEDETASQMNRYDGMLTRGQTEDAYDKLFMDEMKKVVND